MPTSILYATYGPLRITDLQVLNSLVTAINNKQKVTVNPANLNGGIDPFFKVVKWAVVYYNVGENGTYQSRAAKDFDALDFTT